MSDPVSPERQTGRQHEGEGESELQERQSQKSRESRRQGAVYQGAFEAVMAIPIAGGIGYWLDGVFETEPVWLLVGFAIGFASFTVRLIRLGRVVRDGEAEAGGQDEPERRE